MSVPVLVPCPACDARGTVWVDWAETLIQCNLCDGTKQVTRKVARPLLARKQRSERKMRRHFWPRNGQKPSPTARMYRVQVARIHYNDWDAIQRIEWRTVQVFYTAGMALYKLRQLNAEFDDCDDQIRYRVTTPGHRILHDDGNEGKVGEEAFSSYGFSAPDDR